MCVHYREENSILDTKTLADLIRWVLDMEN